MSALPEVELEPGTLVIADLHLDVDVKLVQYIKLANQMTGLGSETVRRPRLTPVGDERERVEGIIAKALETRPNL